MMLDIASVTAEKPGNGAFTRLISRLEKEHPELGLYAECVLNRRFAKTLEKKLGFKAVNGGESFYKIYGQT